jgi:hypothetical protein
MTDPGVIAVALVGLLISFILFARWSGSGGHDSGARHGSAGSHNTRRSHRHRRGHGSRRGHRSPGHHG